MVSLSLCCWLPFTDAMELRLLYSRIADSSTGREVLSSEATWYRWQPSPVERSLNISLCQPGPGGMLLPWVALGTSQIWNQFCLLINWVGVSHTGHKLLWGLVLYWKTKDCYLKGFFFFFFPVVRGKLQLIYSRTGFSPHLHLLRAHLSGLLEMLSPRLKTLKIPTEWNRTLNI